MKLYHPDERKTWKWVLQWHSGGRSCHGDLRLQIDSNRLEGWTLAWILSLPRQPENYKDAENMVDEHLEKNIKLFLNPLKKIISEPKALQPLEWLTIDNATFPEGTVGASKNLKGYMGIVDKGIVEFGSKKSYYHEYFLTGKKLTGRLILRQLPNVWRAKAISEEEAVKTGKGYTVWMSFFADPLPYAISPRALKEHWYPPEGISALPKKVRNEIPTEFQYWRFRGEKAHELRDELIDQIKKDEIKIEFTEIEEFKEKKKKPSKIKRIELTRVQQKELKNATIDKIKIPSSSVQTKLRNTLLYNPPDNLKFWWHIHKGGVAPDCLWLASHSPFTTKTLPTYPGEGKVQNDSYCSLEVEFPDGTHYKILPVKNKKLYESEWVKNWIAEALTKEFGKTKTRSWWSITKDQLYAMKDALKGLVVDVENMDKVDKAFMVFAGQPLIKDIIVVYKQAAKEVYNSFNLTQMEAINLRLKGRDKLNLGLRIDAVVVRILAEEQVQEIEQQLSGLEHFFLELTTSVILTRATRTFFNVSRGLIKGIFKQIVKVPKVGKRIEEAFMTKKALKVRKALEWAVLSAEKKRAILLAKKTAEFARRAPTFKNMLKNWGKDTGKFIIDEVDYFISFWKDCVLIFAPGVAARNMTDNTIKGANEVINSFLEGDLFWAWMKKSGKRIIPVPEAVVKNTFGQDASGLKIMSNIAEHYPCWWAKLHSKLYPKMLGGPEEWARKKFFAGKINLYERKCWAAGKNPEQFAKLMQEKAIKEVNRVFFDYVNKLAIEIPLSKISPFITFNARNFHYWLKDFMYHPWKMGAVRGAWKWWQKHTGSDVDFKIKDKLPMWLIPGFYFQPLSWLSAFKFMRLFAIYKGEPTWIEARDIHVQGCFDMIERLPANRRMEVFTKTDIKDMQDFVDRQKHTWVKITVGLLDEWFGLLPLWTKILAELNLAEREDWKKQFPQGPLIDIAVGKIISMYSKDVDRIHADYFGAISPPSMETLSFIYKSMDRNKVPTEEDVMKEMKSRFQRLSPLEQDIQKRRETWISIERDKEKIKKELRQEIARKIHRAWKMEQIIVGYFTGMWLTRSWADIYRTHRGILETLEMPGEEGTS